MIINKVKASKAGACNFCRSGRLNRTGNGLIYPYRTVYELSGVGSGLVVRVCTACAVEFKKEIK